eukprot:25276_4
MCGCSGRCGCQSLGEEEESLFETISFFLPADADEGDALDADTDDSNPSSSNGTSLISASAISS